MIRKIKSKGSPGKSPKTPSKRLETPENGRSEGFYENTHILRDGNILLYTRPDTQKPVFYARMKFPKRKGYVVRSTKSQNFADAVRFAEDEYDDLRLRHKQGLNLTITTFSQLWEIWWKNTQNLVSVHRQKFHEGTARRYFLPFFGDKNLEVIRDSTIEEYWVWRMNYWKEKNRIRESEKKNLFTRSTPSNQTLRMEGQSLRQMYNWSQRMGYVNVVPLIKSPKPHQTKSHGTVYSNRRPNFTLDEWRKLTRFMRSWVGNEDNYTGGKGKLHKLHYFQRELLRNYVLIMGDFGFRPNESRQIRWRNVSSFKSDGKEIIKVVVPPSTKTGSREVYADAKVVSVFFERVKNITGFSEPDDFVFCDQDGNKVSEGAFSKTFKKLLKDAELLKNAEGMDRTLYSLRHTYATFRIELGKLRPEELADMMGTSPQNIYNHYRHSLLRENASKLTQR